MKEVTVKILGNPCDEHTTLISNGTEETEFYFNGWEGTTSEEILKLLDICGIKYFTVVRNRK